MRLRPGARPELGRDEDHMCFLSLSTTSRNIEITIKEEKATQLKIQLSSHTNFKVGLTLRHRNTADHNCVFVSFSVPSKPTAASMFFSSSYKYSIQLQTDSNTVTSKYTFSKNKKLSCRWQTTWCICTISYDMSDPWKYTPPSYMLSRQIWSFYEYVKSYEHTNRDLLEKLGTSCPTFEGQSLSLELTDPLGTLASCSNHWAILCLFKI